MGRSQKNYGIIWEFFPSGGMCWNIKVQRGFVILHKLVVTPANTEELQVKVEDLKK